MRSHQKYFSVLQEDGTPAPYFLAVSNMETIDRGEKIIEGNERVLRARLSDAEFFWVQDQKQSLGDWTTDLGALIFHEKIGSVSERVARLQSLAAHCFWEMKRITSMQKNRGTFQTSSDGHGGRISGYEVSWVAIVPQRVVRIPWWRSHS